MSLSSSQRKGRKGTKGSSRKVRSRKGSNKLRIATTKNQARNAKRNTQPFAVYAYTKLWDDLINPFLNETPTEEIIEKVLETLEGGDDPRYRTEVAERLEFILSRFGITLEQDGTKPIRDVSVTYRRNDSKQTVFQLQSGDPDNLQRFENNTNRARMEWRVNGEYPFLLYPSHDWDWVGEGETFKLLFPGEKRKTRREILSRFHFFPGSAPKDLTLKRNITFSLHPKFEGTDFDRRVGYNKNVRLFFEECKADPQPLERVLTCLKEQLLTFLSRQPNRKRTVYKKMDHKKWWFPEELKKNPVNIEALTRTLSRTFVSTSEDKDTAERFDGCCMLEIEYNPSKCQVIDVDKVLSKSEQLSQIYNEKEILFPPNTRYTHIRTHVEPSVYIITLRAEAR